MESQYAKIIDIIKKGEVFFITSHAHPDGDGIGATLALGIALERLGKKAVLYNQDPVPKVIDFLPKAEKMVTHVDKNMVFDVSIMLDCAQISRAGRDFPQKEKRGILVCVDHHNYKSGVEADVTCIDETASSTGEVVYNILKRMNTEISTDIATNVLTTIVVDTGFFRYSNTTPRTLEFAAELLRCGTTTWNISKNMEERINKAQLKLLKLSLETIDYVLDDRAAIMVLTNQMITSAGAHVEMAEDFINFPRSVNNVEVAVLVREKNHNEYKISFRSKDRIDVARLAANFGGGGHEHAAGCTIQGDLGTVKRIIVGAIQKVLDK